MSTDRLPPHSPETEQGVIGSILLDPKNAMSECVSRIGGTGDEFFEENFRLLYVLFVQMADDSKPIDLVTVVNELKRLGKLEGIGGSNFISSIIEATPSAGNLPAYLDILQDKFQLRRMVHVCTSIVSRIYDGQGNGIIDEAERDVLSVRSTTTKTTIPAIKELVQLSLNEIERLHQSQGLLSGLSTGLMDLDKMTDGLHPEEMTVIAAFPGNGKTSLAINIAERTAIDAGLAVGVFSLEMSAMQLVLRMLASRSRVNLRAVKDGMLMERDFPKLAGVAQKISKSLLFLDDVSALSIQQIRASARRMKQQHDIRLVVIDYIQLIGTQGNKFTQNREQEVSEISRGIKALARELKLPVLALSQLNDDGKLRESRAIGQDADNVWKIEPESEDDEQEREDAKAMVLRIVKQRNGPTGNVRLTFEKCFTRFEGASKISQSDYYESNIKNVGRNQHNSE